MSLSLAVTAGVLSAAAAVVWRKWVRTLPRERGLEERLETARRRLDTPYTFRRLRASDGAWADVLNAATLQLADVPSEFAQSGDIVAANDERIACAIRAFLSGDGRSVLFMTCIENEPPLVGIASYTSKARYLTVRADRWFSRAPISRVCHAPVDASVAELLHTHVAHVGTDELVAVSSTDDFIHQLERMERLENEWRRAQAEEALYEHDLRMLFGDLYDEVRGLLQYVPSSHIPRATAASLGRAPRRRSV